MHTSDRREFITQAAFALGSLGTKDAAHAAGLVGATERNVRLESHGVALLGTIVFPPSDPPIAALVLVQGSGKLERSLSGARLLASHKFAVLTYDKRGCGQSGGFYEGSNNSSAANLNLLADDAAAAMAEFRHDSELRTIPAGFICDSQAGWIAPIAVVKSPMTKFMAYLSGPVCTVSEQLYFQDWAQNDPNFLKSHTQQQVAKYMRSVRYRSDDVDPRTSLSKLSIPGLWLFGGLDNLVPVELSVARLESLIRQGHQNFSYKIFPNYGHDFANPVADARVPFVVAWMKNIATQIGHSP
jgi:pimeloyl-ACP methyl ester carboxylesterase